MGVVKELKMRSRGELILGTVLVTLTITTLATPYHHYTLIPAAGMLVCAAIILPTLSALLYSAVLLMSALYPAEGGTVTVLLALILIFVVTYTKGPRLGIPSALLYLYLASADLEHGNILPHDISGTLIFGFLLTSAAAVGWFLHTTRARSQAEKAELTTNLHNNVAQHLTSTILRLETLKLDKDLDQPTTEAISHALTDARKTMHEVRALINLSRETADPKKQPTITEDISTTVNYLKGHGLTVNATIPTELSHTTLTHHEAFHVALKEIAVNVVKYADPTHVVRIMAEHKPNGQLHLLVSNKQTQQQIAPTMTTNFGLDYVAQLLADSGGQLTCGLQGDTWVTVITIT